MGLTWRKAPTIRGRVRWHLCLASIVTWDKLCGFRSVARKLCQTYPQSCPQAGLSVDARFRGNGRSIPVIAHEQVGKHGRLARDCRHGKQLNKVLFANGLKRAVAVRNPRDLAHAEKDGQDVAEGCMRLIKNSFRYGKDPDNSSRTTARFSGNPSSNS